MQMLADCMPVPARKTSCRGAGKTQGGTERFILFNYKLRLRPSYYHLNP